MTNSLKNLVLDKNIKVELVEVRLSGKLTEQ